MNGTNVRKPSNYTTYPYGSVVKSRELEVVARNIMVLLKRTGDAWRKVTLEEYIEGRKQDGAKLDDLLYKSPPEIKYSEVEAFGIVAGYCESSEKADSFCESWFREDVRHD